MGVEQSRYQMILDAFIELGGSRNMWLGASGIQDKIINGLKLKNNLFMESLNSAVKRRHPQSQSDK